MFFQLIGSIMGIIGWFVNYDLLFYLGGVICIGVIVFGIFSQGLNPGGIMFSLATLLIGGVIGGMLSIWYRGVFGAAILMEGIEGLIMLFEIREK